MSEIIHNVFILGNKDSENLLPPAKENDACFDLIAKEMKIVGERPPWSEENELFEDYWSHIDYIEYNTGVSIAPENRRMFSIIASRSSVSKYNLVLANAIGIIDNGYRNTIAFRFKYTWQPGDFMISNGVAYGRLNREKIYKIGDKVGQIFFDETPPVRFTLLADLPKSDRGMGGFGSTGT